MMSITTRLMIFETIASSRVCSHNVRVSTALTAQFVTILGEVSNFLHSFVKLFLPDMPTNFFIEIGLYLTDTEQKISWHVFEIRCSIVLFVLPHWPMAMCVRIFNNLY